MVNRESRPAQHVDINLIHKSSHSPQDHPASLFIPTAVFNFSRTDDNFSVCLAGFAHRLLSLPGNDVAHCMRTQILSPPLLHTCSVAFLVAILLTACASAPDTGVRDRFAENRVTSVAVVTFYSSASFGLPSSRLRELEEIYEQAATQSLRRQGFQVVDSHALSQHLTQLGYWNDFEEGIYLRTGLHRYFEPVTERQRQSIEIHTLRKLAQKGAFPAESLLFGEIVYHSEGQCREKADDHVRLSIVSITDSAPQGIPRPCVTSHFRAKLVDPVTGETMWFNQMLFETHTGQVDAETIANTIRGAVEQTLQNDDGLTPLAPQAGSVNQHSEAP